MKTNTVRNNALPATNSSETVANFKEISKPAYQQLFPSRTSLLENKENQLDGANVRHKNPYSFLFSNNSLRDSAVLSQSTSQVSVPQVSTSQVPRFSLFGKRPALDLSKQAIQDKFLPTAPNSARHDYKVEEGGVQIFEDAMQPYYEQILAHLTATQQANRVSENPMECQVEVNKRMRLVLFNWLLQVHQKYDLKTRTFFLACNIFDRFVGSKRVRRGELQLIGLASLLIASKYEDIYPPEVDQLCQLTEHFFNREQLLAQESEILSGLSFNLVFVASLDIMELIAKVWKISCPEVINLATFVLHIFAFYHFGDKFEVLKLASFALLYALRKVRGERGPEKNAYLTVAEFERFALKLGKIAFRIKYDNLLVLREKFKGISENLL